MTDNRIRPSRARRRAALRLALLAALALGVLGCGDPPQPPSTEPAPAEPPTEPSPAPLANIQPNPPPGLPTEPVSPCRVEPLGMLAASERARRLTLLPGADADGSSTAEGLTLLIEGATTELIEGATTELIRLTPSFVPSSRRVLPTRFEAALRVGNSIVALAAGPADANGLANYRALRLGESARDDAELLLPVAVPRGGAVLRNRVGDQVVFTWTDGRRPPLALRFFSPGRAPLRFDAAYPLSPEIDLEDARAVQLLRVALDERSFAAIVRVGSAEGIGSEVVLARPSGQVPVHALEDIADIEAMAIVGDQVWVIATFEFSRPLLLRIAPSGELLADPEELARDATLPAELAGGDPARLMVEGERLLLRRRNPMGDPLLPDALVALRADATLPADVLRDAERYVVVYQDRDEASGSWPIRFASLHCGPR